MHLVGRHTLDGGRKGRDQGQDNECNQGIHSNKYS
jgi:hypothetical protein